MAGLVEGIEQRQSAILGNVIASSPQEAAYSWEAVRCGQTAVGTVVCDAYLAETGPIWPVKTRAVSAEACPRET